jgi:hypothetical protein
MNLDLKSLTQSILTTIFGITGDVVKDATYVRPTSFAVATGVIAAGETTAAVKALIGRIPDVAFRFRAHEHKEKVLIRASELAGITAPAAGDYIIENLTGIRRDIVLAALDPTGLVWSFNTVRSLDEDWGDLTPHATSEDWADLTAATENEDRGALYE